MGVCLNGLSIENRSAIFPEFKKGKTMYWIWGDKIMPVYYLGVQGVYIDPKTRQIDVVCQKKTKQDISFFYTYRGKKMETVVKKGEIRYFYVSCLGETMFLTRKEAEEKLNKTKTN